MNLRSINCGWLETGTLLCCFWFPIIFFHINFLLFCPPLFHSSQRPPPMFSRKTAKILTVKTKHNKKQQQQKKPFAVSRAWHLQRKSILSRLLFWLWAFKKSNLKLKATLLSLFSAASALPLKSYCHCFSGEDSRGAIRKN